MSAWAINIVRVYINVQCIIFMFNCIVSTILTSSTSSVSVHNDGFMEYNKWMNEWTDCAIPSHWRSFHKVVCTRAHQNVVFPEFKFVTKKGQCKRIILKSSIFCIFRSVYQFYFTKQISGINCIYVLKTYLWQVSVQVYHLQGAHNARFISCGF